MKTRPERFKEAIDRLLKKKLTKVSIAKDYGISRQALDDWINGKGLSEVTAEPAIKLALLAGMNPEWLVLGTGARDSLDENQRILLEGFPLIGELHQRGWIDTARAHIDQVASKSKTA